MADIVQQHSSLPVIGNGDILTHYEAAARWQSTGVAGVMVGRGALIKPWLFQEIQEVGKMFCRVLASMSMCVYHCKPSNSPLPVSACCPARHAKVIQDSKTCTQPGVRWIAHVECINACNRLFAQPITPWGLWVPHGSGRVSLHFQVLMVTGVTAAVCQHAILLTIDCCCCNVTAGTRAPADCSRSCWHIPQAGIIHEGQP